MSAFWQKIKKFDYFELGNSFFLYCLLLFGSLPLAIFLNLPSKYVQYFIGQNISVIDSQTFVYLLLAILFFILGYRLNFFSWLSSKKSLINIFKKNWNPNNIPWTFGIVFIFGLLIKILRIFGGGYFHLHKNQAFVSSPFYSLIGLLDWLAPTALAIAFAYYFYLLKINDSRYKIWQIAAWLTFGLEFLYGFFSGSKFYSIIPIIVYLIVRHYIYVKSFKRVLIAGVLIIFVLMPSLNFYRDSSIFFHAYTDTTDGRNRIGLENFSQFVIDNSFGRLSQSKIIFNVFEKTDKFSHGRSLLNFFISLGPPRFIWKDKPAINAGGNEFGRAYKIINANDFQTSVGPTIIGDLYMNFGLWGIIFGMLIIGALYRLIFDLFVKKTNNSLSGVIIYSIFWIQLIKGTEGWIAPVWAGLVKLFIIMLVIHYFLTKKSNYGYN